MYMYIYILKIKLGIKMCFFFKKMNTEKCPKTIAQLQIQWRQQQHKLYL